MATIPFTDVAAAARDVWPAIEHDYLDCLFSGGYIGGPAVASFETAWARYCGAGHGVGVANGTSALQLTLTALGIGPGDEVIVPTLTYVASVNAVGYVGATPVFADCLFDTWQIDPEDVANRITPRTKAIIAVHLYGQSCDMDRLMAIAKGHGLVVIGDCAEAFGTLYGNCPVARLGNIAAYSFFGNKTITTGEGGMVFSKDDALIDRCRRLRGQGLVPGTEYWHDIIGFNYRMSNVAAAIGLAQLERADELLQLKRRLAENYFRRLSNLPLEFHREAPGTVHAYWLVSALLENELMRDGMRRYLADAGIETRPVFHPVHTMGLYPHHLPEKTVAGDIAARGLNLPSWPDLSEDEFAVVSTAIEKFFANA